MKIKAIKIEVKEEPVEIDDNQDHIHFYKYDKNFSDMILDEESICNNKVLIKTDIYNRIVWYNPYTKEKIDYLINLREKNLLTTLYAKEGIGEEKVRQAKEETINKIKHLSLWKRIFNNF